MSENLPDRFICVYRVQSKNVLFQVLRREECWIALRWSSAGYWTQNGGGEITQSQAKLYYSDGKNVLVVCDNYNPTPPRD